MHYNPLSYIRNEADILKFVNALISNTKGEGKEGDPFWQKSETLLYCALIAYIIFEGPEEDRNMNTLVDMISGMEVKEDDDEFMNAVDYMFKGLEKRKPDCFAVKQYKKYKLASGVVCSKRLLIPNIVIRKTKPLGHYGRLRKAYLEMHRPILFNELVLSDKLFEHCAEIDEAARNRMELIVRSLAEQNGVTEQLKAENQMEWVRQMNACKAQAEEIVKAELIYD